MEDINIQALIEQGKDYSEPVETELGQFWIRPLSEGERLQLASLSMRGMKSTMKSDIIGGDAAHPMQAAQTAAEKGINKEMIMDHEKWVASQAEARFQRLAWGLSCRGQNHNPTLIKKLKGKGMKKALDLVHQAIINLTEGVEPKAEPFSPDDAGKNAGSDSSPRDPISEDSGGSDTDSEKLHGASDSKAD